MGRNLGFTEDDPRAHRVKEMINHILSNIVKDGNSATGALAVNWDMIKIALPQDATGMKLPKKEAATSTTDDTTSSLMRQDSRSSHRHVNRGVGTRGSSALSFTGSFSSTVFGGLLDKEDNLAGAGTVGVQTVSGNNNGNNNSNGGWELPIYDNQADILITRTYKLSPELITFEEHLKQADDPLSILYKEFHPFLNKLQNDRFLQACLPKDLKDHKWLELLPLLWNNMQRLWEDCKMMLPFMDTIDNITKNLIQIIKNIRRTTIRNGMNGNPMIGEGGRTIEFEGSEAEMIQSSVLDIVRLNGDLEAQLIGNNLRLLEFRSFFDRVHANAANELAVLTKENRQLAEIYDSFLKTQGVVLEIQERLLAVKERCQRYRVDEYLPAHFKRNYQGSYMAEEGTSSSWGDLPIQPTINFHPMPTLHNKPSSSLPVLPPNATLEQALEVITRLQQELQMTEQEIEDLEMELMELIQARDRTPAAILFFALMNDPAFIPNLQQLVLQFDHLKKFLNYTVHMDYVTLRKRLHVCLALMPSIEKLVEKYGIMHSSWSQVRLNWFAERKLRGGSADSLTYCPLCYTNLEPEEGQPSKTSPKRSESGKKIQQERKMMKAQRKTLIQSSQTISLPALPSARPMSISGSATTMSDRSSSSHLNSISSAFNMNNRRMM